MSVRALNWAFEQKVGDPTRKIILMILADHAGADNTCWPSVITIAQKAECHIDTVRRHLKVLHRTGFVDVTPRLRSNGSDASNSYTVNVGMAPRKLPRVGMQIARGEVCTDAPPYRTTTKNLTTTRGNYTGRGGYRGRRRTPDDEVPE